MAGNEGSVFASLQKLLVSLTYFSLLLPCTAYLAYLRSSEISFLALIAMAR